MAALEERLSAGPAAAVGRLEDAGGVPHFHGHRDRLRARFREQGASALADYELLEMALYGALPRGDTKPLAKALLKKFGTLNEVLAAPRERLKEVPGIGDRAVDELKLIKAFAERTAGEAVRKRPVLSSWSALLDYCRAAMAFEEREQFRILSQVAETKGPRPSSRALREHSWKAL